MKNRIAVVVFSLLLVVSPLYPQTPTPPDTMQNVFDRTQHAIDMVNEGCSSDECASAAAALTQMVETGKAKHASNSLAGAERDKFLDDLVKGFTAAQLAITHEQEREEQGKKAAAVAVKCKPNTLFMTQCQECDYVYKAALAICSLYALGGCRLCAIACVLVATRSYTICIRAYCS